jgi:hypothetical protein
MVNVKSACVHNSFIAVLRIRIQDPGSSASLTPKYLNSLLRIRIRDPVPFDPWIRDLGWKNSDQHCIDG